MYTKGRLVLYGLFILVFVAFAQAQSCVPPPQGITHWWPADGTTEDVIAGNNGTLQNGATFGQGFVGNAFLFDGIDDFVDVQNTTVNTPQLAYETWAYASSFGGSWNDIVVVDQALGGARNIIVQAWDQRAVVYGSPLQSATMLNPNQWYHFAYTHDGVTGNLYINGSLETTAPFPLGIPGTYVTIGVWSGFPEWWSGFVDELAFYNRALSAAEIQNIYRAGRAGKCLTLSIGTSSLPSSVIGQFYSHEFLAVRGTLLYIWSLVNGAIPQGMNLHANGILNGTPTAAGNYTFTVRVTDANNSRAEKTFTLQVYATLPPPRLTILKTGTVAVPGRILEYFIAVTNDGDFPVHDVVVDEYLDRALFNLTSTDPPATIIGNESHRLHIISWNVSVLAPSEIKILRYSARLNASLPIGINVTGGPAVVNMRLPSNRTGGGSWNPLPLPQNGHRIAWGGGWKCAVPFRHDHAAVDIEAPVGTSVSAVAPGEVFYAGEFGEVFGQGQWPYWLPLPCRQSLYGKTVILRHANNEYTFYAHLSEILVQRGQQVTATTQIGRSGVTGAGGCAAEQSPVGPHLHFGYFRGGIRGGDSVNPCESLKRVANPESCSCADGGDSDEHIQTTTRPIDPNEKEVIANRFVRSDQTLVYPIHFENIGNVSALDVFVTDVLDQNINVSTVRLLSPNGTFTPQTGVIRWSLFGVNLQPNATGVVMFSAMPYQGLPSGTVIRNNATIQFEIFENITTNTVENIIDDIQPSCVMHQLPNITTSLNFTISWSGTDAIGEIDTFTIFSAVDGGAFSPLISSTRETNMTFIGERGRTYQFLCIATDTAGNIEVQAPLSEATIQIAGPRLALLGVPRIGMTVNLSVSDPLYPGRKSVLAMSLGTMPGIPLGDGRVIPLNPDIIFLVSLQAPQWIGLRNNIMLLDSQGRGMAFWDIPRAQALINQTVFAAFIIVDHQQQPPIASISNAVSITMQQ